MYLNYINDHIDFSYYFYMVVKVVNIDVSKKLNQLPRSLQPCQIGCQKVAALSKKLQKSYRLVKKKLPKSCSLVKVVCQKVAALSK